jgi:hypothetical protein
MSCVTNLYDTAFWGGPGVSRIAPHEFEVNRFAVWYSVNDLGYEGALSFHIWQGIVDGPLVSPCFLSRPLILDMVSVNNRANSPVSRHRPCE